MAASFSGTALSAGGKIGRNFTVVTLLPSLCLTMWVYALIASDAWPREPNLRLLGDRVGAWGVGDFAWLLLLSVVVGLFVHPLQFPTVQLLEGYWGTSRLARAAMAARIRHYRRKSRSTFARAGDHDDAILDAYAARTGTDAEPDDRQLAKFLDNDGGDPVVADVIARDEFREAEKRYPAGARIMPTRLGNAMRLGEDTAGRQYGLDSIVTAPHFTLVSAPPDVAYLADAREQLDTAVRLCSVSLVATVITVPPLLTDGVWLLVALIPYTLAYVAYRSAVSAAAEFTTALSTLIDLNRFTLYQRMGVPRPASTTDERRNNQRLMELMRKERNVRVRYEKLVDGGGEAGG